MAVTLASVDGTWTNSPTYDAAELRRADAAMFSSAGIASGLVVSVDGSDEVTVTAGQAVISGEDAVAGTGVYRAGIGSSVAGSLEARNATNGRIDLVVFRQYDTDVVGTHPKFKSEIEIITGTPSATPAVPAKPSMATELGRIPVPASGGGAASVDSSNRVFAAAVNGDSKPRVRVKRTSNLTLVGDTDTTVSWQAADYEVGEFWSSGANIVIPSSGLYALAAGTNTADATAGENMGIAIAVNGTVIVGTGTGELGSVADLLTNLSCSIVAPLTAGDVITLRARCTMAGSLQATVSSAASGTFLQAVNI